LLYWGRGGGRVPRQCQIVDLVKVGWKKRKALGSEKRKVMGSDSWQYGGEGRNWALGIEFCVSRAAV